MSKSKSIFNNISKGFLIGIGALIPGLSGGTIAVITEVFEPLLESVANIFKHFSKSLKFMLPIAIGAIFALIIAPPLIERFTGEYPKISKWIFILITMASTYVFARKNIEFTPKLSKFICFFAGIMFSYAIMLVTASKNIESNNFNFLYLILLGIPLSFALILPAISFSYMLLFLGLYDTFITSVGEFDLKFLLPLSVGTFFGCLLFSKILLKALSRYKQQTYSTILGFSVSSLINILLK